MMRFLQKAFLIAAVLVLCNSIYAQNKFEGYSLTVEANTDGACPIRYLPSANYGNSIEVYIAGTNQRSPATNLTACGESEVRQNGNVFANGYGRWCFNGPEPFYDIKLKNGTTYLWYAITKETGFFNVKDFRPVTRTPGPTPQYVFSEPADYTQTIRNAVAFIAARQGGALRFPDGDYVVGTLDGNRPDPKYEAITLPSGIIVQGTSSNQSVPGSDWPFKTSSTRIRLRNPNQTIFRIGGCTNLVTIRDMELLGNSSLLGEGKRDSKGTYGIEGLGKWAIDPRTKAENSGSSQVFRFENLTLQNFDKAIYVHNANDDRCNPQDQRCHGWQFDYVKVDHVNFLNNGTGIFIDTFNTDWKVTNSVFNYLANFNPPGDGIRLKKVGSMLIEQTWGGGGDYATHIGGTFINIDFVNTITIINSGSERGQRSIYTNPAGAVLSEMITVVGGGFSDKVELHGRVNYASMGNTYGPKTIQAGPEVTITSVGDRFCIDPNILPTACTDESGKFVNKPNFGGGRVMFQTGRLPESKGPTRIEAKPNLFGYNVEIRDGLMQYDPNVNFKLINDWASGADGRPPVKDGAFVYCNDCRRGNLCSQGTAGTDGAFAKRVNGQWRCD